MIVVSELSGLAKNTLPAKLEALYDAELNARQNRSQVGEVVRGMVQRNLDPTDEEPAPEEPPAE
jgi:hypothetical protein